MESNLRIATTYVLPMKTMAFSISHLGHKNLDNHKKAGKDIGKLILCLLFIGCSGGLR